MWSKKAKYVVKNAKYVISKTQKVAFLAQKWGCFVYQMHCITIFATYKVDTYYPVLALFGQIWGESNFEIEA